MLKCKMYPGGVPDVPVPITKEGIISLFVAKGLDVDMAANWMMIRFGDGSALQISQVSDDNIFGSHLPQGDVYVTYFVDAPEREDEP